MAAILTMIAIQASIFLLGITVLNHGGWEASFVLMSDLRVMYYSYVRCVVARSMHHTYILTLCFMLSSRRRCLMFVLIESTICTLRTIYSYLSRYSYLDSKCVHMLYSSRQLQRSSAIHIYSSIAGYVAMEGFWVLIS